MIRVFSADDVARSLPYDQLIDALEEAFSVSAIVPLRSHHAIDVPGAASGTLLLMPAWTSGDSLGVKIVTVFPDNGLRGLAAVHASYLLLDARTGTFRAMMDGGELTLRRTACASALASRYLSRKDANTLLMVGTGKLAPHLIGAHATARSISSVRIWGRRIEAAQSLAEEMQGMRFDVSVAEDLESAVHDADIISCATLATDPLIHGEWLQAGQHLDLVGAFTPKMREADSAAVARADVYVDTRAGTLSEAGEILQAIDEGRFSESGIKAELAELVRGEKAGRTSDSTITLFKSTGTALEDLAAAMLVASQSDPAAKHAG
ncbi:MAG: ornithine cyclodeaminase family protein [Gammaproteobacteria bacterium]|nr:ornithine cyclodeaminase family protein [Gammaproteobacteria bacterium]MDH4315228.1 ornithine cyclodeaminase family protein [Gammaproteobacteria bacterium]MDH5215008.1 ornithine cyclodeaminase family protein [Gammaproteobacteria bacterium]MDH5501132.1 ornithine cyclodeaminase family protein [Gammaproteobacteria bacterium]